jgi:hypothetical protein
LSSDGVCQRLSFYSAGESLFYANEGNEPIHVHCRKGNMECKYWLDVKNFDLQEAYSFNLSPKDKREVRKIIFDNFEHIEQQWNEFQQRR